MTESRSILRVLVAAPRPAGLEPMPSRSHIEAMFDALEAQGDRVEIRWLYPGTAEALVAALAGDDMVVPDVVLLDAAMTGGAGPSALLESEMPEGRALRADELGAILQQGSAGLLVLRAAAVAADYAQALARDAEMAVMRLDEGLDEAAVRAAMTAALAALLAGHAPVEATQEARRALGERRAAVDPEEGVTLHGSGHGPVVAPQTGGRGVGKVVRFPGTELQPPWQRLPREPAEGGLPPEPELGVDGAGGWVGRAAELVALERAAHDEAGNGITLVHGYHGAGKTTLAVHAARWLVRTGRFQQVVYVSYANGGYAERTLHALGTRLVGERYDLRAPDSAQRVERALNETPTLIIWDDVDALLPEGETPIGAADLEELLKLGARLAGIGGSRLWVLSQVARLPHPDYREGAVALALPLGGMLPGDAEALARGAWPAHALDAMDGEALRHLTWRLGGQPLALRGLAPLLERASPEEVGAALERILPGFDAGEARLRGQAADLVLQALLRSVEEETRPKLDALGVFAGGLMRPLGGNVAGLEDAEWDGLIRLLGAAGLVRQLELPGFNVPLLRFHPALTRHLARRLPPPMRAGALHRHAGAYLGLLKWMTRNAEQHGAVVRALALWELANFRRGLGTLCDARELNVASDYANEWQRLLVDLGFRSEHQEAARRLREAVAQVAPPEGPLQRAGVHFLIAQGEQLLASGRAPEAAAVLQHLVDRMGAEGGTAYSGPEVAYDLARARRRLGRSLVALGRGDAAVAALTAALEALKEAGRSSPADGVVIAGPRGERSGAAAGEATAEARQEAMLAHQDLGDAYLAGGRPAEAAEAYRQGLEMARELGDRRLMGALNAQLGTIAMAQDDKDTARQHLEAALFHLQTADDAAGMSAIWSQLGTLAWRGTDLDEADRCYQQALELARQAQQPLVEAQVHLQLALTARQADRLADAEAHYTQAIRLYQENDVRAGLASTEVALAELLLAEGEVEKARVHAEAARAVAEDPRVVFDAWAVYALLQRIAEAQGDAERVAHWRARTQESFARSPEAQQVLQQWQGVITGVANAAHGEALDADTVTLLEQLEERQEWRDLVGVIWRVLGGERGRELYAELDHVDALVVRRTLEAIEKPPEATEAEDGDGDSEAERWPVPLPQLMSAVVAGLRGDANARRLVAAALTRMARDDAPESARRFAAALSRILQGERDEALLEGLPKETAEPLAALLRALRQMNAKR